MGLEDDFAGLDGPHAPDPKRARTAEGERGGEERAWLRIWETPPCQMHCAYGRASWGGMSDAKLFSKLSVPFKSGAKYATEPHARWEALFCLIPVLRGNASFTFFNTSAVKMQEKHDS